MIKGFLSLILLSFSMCAYSQFAGPAGTPSSTAIHRDSSIFVNWANQAELDLGLQDIANQFSGTASSGDNNSPLGFPDGNCISLGDSGVAILRFPLFITNGPGPDFAVFENGFSDAFLELAFVEVSSDGSNYTRFPAVSNTQTQTQVGPFDLQGDATLLNNLAGKYRINFGTPFDLEELSGTPGLDINAITHVKIIDVVGVISGDHVQYDSNGNPINDPYPTAFPQGGFDLDAIGVINEAPLGLNDQVKSELTIYPNPANSNSVVTVSSQHKVEELSLISMSGKLISRSNTHSIKLENCPAGIYLIRIQSSDGIFTSKIVVH